jgi:hypothetical protein
VKCIQLSNNTQAKFYVIFSDKCEDIPKRPSLSSSSAHQFNIHLYHHYVQYDIIIMVGIKIMVFWDMTLCSLVKSPFHP